MQVIKRSTVLEEFNRDLYWFVVIFECEKKTLSLYACVSWEYMLDTYKLNTVTQTDLRQWQNEVIEEFIAPKYFEDESTYHLSYANYIEGRKNGLEYLDSISH